MTMAGVDFFRAFLKNWKEVGWPFQTSRIATRKICSTIDFQNARRVVEIGGGTGALTRELLKELSDDGRLIVFETNEDLCRHLRKIEDSRLTIYNASGFLVSQLLNEKADVVISAVPIAALSDLLMERFYRGVQRILREGGCCIQLQLSLLSYPKLKKLFRTVDIGFTMMNTAPMFIYRCKP
jgi:phospholipid N-methyltransferase